MNTSYSLETMTVTLCGKKGFEGIIKSRALRRGDYSGGSNVIARMLKSERQEGGTKRAK